MKEAMVEEKYMTRQEVADLFKKSLHTIARWERDGLKSFRVGRSVLYDIDDVQTFVDDRKAA